MPTMAAWAARKVPIISICLPSGPSATISLRARSMIVFGTIAMICNKLGLNRIAIAGLCRVGLRADIAGGVGGDLDGSDFGGMHATNASRSEALRRIERSLSWPSSRTTGERQKASET